MQSEKFVKWFYNMHKKTFYKGLYGNDSIEFVKGLINIYPFGVIGKKHNNEVKLHAHNNLFQLFIIEKGSTTLFLEDQQIEVESPAFITIPKNMEHGFVHGPNVDGWIINLSDTVLESMLQQEAEVIFEIDAIHIIRFDNSNKDVSEMRQTIQKCVAEYQGERPGKLLMLQNLVGQLMIQLYRLSSENKIVLTETDNTSKVIYRRFLNLLKSDYSFKITVDEYAQKLSISSGHLNRICRMIAGKSPKDIIIDFFISEAQLNLSNVDLSITDVAYKLNFEDPGYFTRLFRKKTGMTPKSFREKIGVKQALVTD